MTIMPVSAFHDEIRAGKLAAYPIEDVNLHRILILARPVAEARSAAIDEVEHIVRAEMAGLLQAGFFRMPAGEAASLNRQRPWMKKRNSKRGPKGRVSAAKR
jgi:hypothetical protein